MKVPMFDCSVVTLRKLGLIGLLVTAQLGYGQVAASISGRVTDPSGAGVSAAAVTVKSVETGATRTASSNGDGDYFITGLALGRQEVHFEKATFKTMVRTGVDLVVGQNAVVNVTLEVGPVSDSITVTEELPLVNTTTSQVFGLVNERQIKDLPLNGRSFDNLITLNPSAINYPLRSSGTSTSNGSNFSVAGRRPLENIFLLNGIEYTGSSQLSNTPGGVSGQLLGVEAVREFNLLTDNYSAEYGKRAGAQVNVVTQSGTNAVHGSVFEFIRNNKLDARNFFDRASTPAFRRNQFGVALGGPIKKDKIFLFGNYEGFRERLSVTNVTVVPNNEARQGRMPNAAGVYSTVANLDARMLPFVQQLWPEVNGPQLLANGVETGTALSFNNPRRKIREDFGTARGDYNIGSNDTFNGSYTIDDGDGIIPAADPLFGSNLKLRSQVLSAQETHVFSPRVVNTFRAGFSRAAFGFDAVEFKEFPASLAFVPGQKLGGFIIGGGNTTTGLAAITAGGSNNAANVMNRRNLFTVADTVSISTGRHQISTGVWFQRMQDNENSASRRLGQATFATLTTFLQGTTTNLQAVPNPSGVGFRSLFGAWFVDDTIRLRRNLTVELGLRHEFTTGWNEVAGRAGNWITDSNGVLITEPRTGSSAFTKNNATRLFSPRVSLAWDVFGNGKTAIRAGFGTYYTLIDNLAFLLNSIPPYNGSVTFTGSLFSALPITAGVQPRPACSPTVPQPCTTFAPQGVQADAKTPALQNWNFSIEQQLTSNMTLRVAYIGSHGYHGLLSLDPNTVPAQICATATCVTGGTGTARGAVNQGQQYIPVGTRPNPYLAGGFFWTTQGNSSYNGLQVELTRRLARGFQARGNFTWSKNLDMNSALTGAQANNQAQMLMDRSNLRRDWGPAAFDVRKQSTISFHYDLPFGPGQQFMSANYGAMSKIVGGWQLNSITTLLSGFPFTPLVGANRSSNGDTRNPDRPNYNPNFTGDIILGQPTRWFDPNAFSLPTVGTFGNVGRGVLRGPGLSNVDFSVNKNTRISERFNLQFRAEFFNLLNRTNFSVPNTTVFSGTSFNASAGLITATTTTSRQIQGSLKLIF
ncbi:MAG: carboxypeptidase-like regulatory domain-containing protein [Bryobacteraceae bacterium]